MTAHYNHSVIGQKFLHQCQELYGLGKSNPPKDNATRTGWGGAFTQAKWFMDNQEAVQMYDVEHTVKAKNAMDNPDGSKYKDHKLTQSEWNTVRESVFVLQHPKGAVMLLQATKKSTVNIVLPVIGKLLEALHEETVLKWEKRPVQTQCEVVRDGRQNLYKAVKKRFTNDLMSCKLEDFCVATTLDPRYKTFKFPKSTDWDRANTWEPIENLAGHEQDIASFRSKREEENHERAVKKKKQSENVEVIDDDAPKWVEGKSGKRKSAVWQLFQVELADGKVLRTRCKLCPDSTEPQQYPGNTSNLRSHLTHGDSAHKDAFCEVCKIEKEEVNLQKEESTTDSKPRTIYALHAAPCVPG
eukprot:gene30587-biopygen31907